MRRNFPVPHRIIPTVAVQRLTAAETMQNANACRFPETPGGPKEEMDAPTKMLQGVHHATRYKTLVGARMKRSGQRWGMEGGKAILAFRALVKSGRFDAAWTAILDHHKQTPAENDNRFPQSYKAAA